MSLFPDLQQQQQHGASEARRTRVVGFVCVVGLVGTLIAYWPELQTKSVSRNSKSGSTKEESNATPGGISGRWSETKSLSVRSPKWLSVVAATSGNRFVFWADANGLVRWGNEEQAYLPSPRWRVTTVTLDETPTILALGPQTFALLGRSPDRKSLGFLKLGDGKSPRWVDLGGADYSPPAAIETGKGKWELASGALNQPLFTADFDAGRTGPLGWELRHGVLASRHLAVRDDATHYIVARGSDKALWTIPREKTWGTWRTLGGDSSEDIAVAAEALNGQLFAVARSRKNQLTLWLAPIPVGEVKALELPVEIVGTPYAVAVPDLGGFLAVAATAAGKIVAVGTTASTRMFGEAQTIANGTKVLHAAAANGRTVVVEYLNADGSVASKTFSGNEGALSVRKK